MWAVGLVGPEFPVVDGPAPEAVVVGEQRVGDGQRRISCAAPIQDGAPEIAAVVVERRVGHLHRAARAVVADVEPAGGAVAVREGDAADVDGPRVDVQDRPGTPAGERRRGRPGTLEGERIETRGGDGVVLGVGARRHVDGDVVTVVRARLCRGDRGFDGAARSCRCSAVARSSGRYVERDRRGRRSRLRVEGHRAGRHAPEHQRSRQQRPETPPTNCTHGCQPSALGCIRPARLWRGLAPIAHTGNDSHRAVAR